MIPKDSYHSYEHKISAINYLINRVSTYPITKEAKKEEVTTIESILRNKNLTKTLAQKCKENTDTQQK
jgi:hypothetical protein